MLATGQYSHWKLGVLYRYEDGVMIANKHRYAKVLVVT
jgi:hypothetical protein